MTHYLLLSALLASAASPALPQAAAAPKGPQAVSKAVYLSRVDSGFTAIDGNKDGFVDRAEYEAAEAKAIAVRRAQILKQDKSGSLSLTEFNSLVAAEPTRKPDVTPRMTRLDNNKDGRVSMAENRAPATAQFERLDANKDGILSVEEQRARQRR